VRWIFWPPGCSPRTSEVGTDLRAVRVCGPGALGEIALPRRCLGVVGSQQQSGIFGKLPVWNSRFWRFLGAVFPSSRWGWIRPGPTRLDKNSLGQPTCWGRIDDPLSFRAQWFLNRQVPSVFIPSLTSTFSIGCYRSAVDFSNRAFPFFLKNCKARSLEYENYAKACD